MKQLFITIITCLAMIGWAHANTLSYNGLKPTTPQNRSETTSLEVPTVAFDAIHASQGVIVNLVSRGDKILIEADNRVIRNVVVKAEGSILKISIQPNIRLRNTQVRVTIPTNGRICELKAASSAEIICETPITTDNLRLTVNSSGEIIVAAKADKCHINGSSSGSIHAGISAVQCSIDASSSSEIKGTIIATECEISSSSSAEITLSGEADKCRAVCTSSSDFDAQRFAVKSYDIHVSSSADAEIHCTEQLVATAYSAGSISYSGECSITKEASGGGTITNN